MARKRHKYNKSAVNAYGGSLQKSRLGRFCGRPVWPGCLMHLIIKSTQAQGSWSFRRPENYQMIGFSIERFAAKHGLEVHDYAIHHNHVHMSLTPSKKEGYVRFIRALTSAISMFIKGVSRWCGRIRKRFFDRRPYSRIAFTPPEEGVIGEYIRLNKLEAAGFARAEARKFLRQENKECSCRWKAAQQRGP